MRDNENLSSHNTIEILRATFARHGLPDCIVTDNGTSFTRNEFQSFMKSNGMRHIRSAPFKPASNGQAERAVQVVKNGLKRVSGGSLQTHLFRFLLSYLPVPIL